jgi:hypothetical protein
MTRALISLFVLLALGASATPSRRTAVVTRVTTPPRLDGQLAEWSPGLFAVTTPLTLAGATSTLETGRIDGDADHSAEVWLTTTPGALHLAALITDDDVRASHDAPELYRDDGLELLLARRDGGLFHLGVNANGLVWRFDGGSLDGVKVAVVKRAPGFSVEATIPLSAFGATDATLDGWAVNVAARDVDGTEVAHRVWSGVSHSQRASMGTLTVVKAAREPAEPPPCAAPKRVVTLTQPLAVSGDRLVAGDAGVTLKLVNYQPADRPWARQWTEFDATQTQVDFERAAQVGANAVRLFVFYGPFGEHRVSAELLQRLKTVVALAAKAGLVSVVSFFPFDKEFRPSAWPGMGAHLKTIVETFANDPAIAMWDLMNEPDHAWAAADAGVSAREVSAWAQEMTRVVKAADPSHLITVGLAGHFAAGDGGVRADEALPFVDVVSVHGYFDDVPLPAFLERAKALRKPVVLQEYGRSRLYWTGAEAAAFDARVCADVRAAGLSGVGAWELYDHPVGTIDWLREPWRESAENWFGLLNADGRRTQRAKAFCTCLESQRFVITPR